MLTEIRGVLAKRRDDVSPYVLGSSKMSYADIVLSCSLLFMRRPPHANFAMLHGENVQRAFEETDLALEFTDLLEWRDARFMERLSWQTPRL